MTTLKQKIHSILESVVHNTVSSGKGRKATLVIPYYELTKELGFGEPNFNNDVKLTIKLEILGDEYEQ